MFLRFNNLAWSICGIVLIIHLGSLNLKAEENLIPGSTDPQEVRLPQTFLNLIHAHEVQQELGMKGTSLDQFLPRLQQIDGPWWRCRILQESERRKITSQQERLLADEIQQRFGAAALARLRQIEYQAQGYRSLLRPELARFLQLTPEQMETLQRTFSETDALLAKRQQASAEVTEELQAELQQAQSREAKLGPEILTPDQQTRLRKAIGNLFDTSQLDRIYPLAPELIDSGAWTSKAPTTLRDLRGKVVLLHFYAFQCSNCKANFPIYNRWHTAYQRDSSSVQLLGIQTPETSAERDVEKVREAAVKDRFQYPVLIDTESKNWTEWSNTMWPTVYVIDKRGYIRFWWQGELNWKGATVDQTIEKIVSRLLLES